MLLIRTNKSVILSTSVWYLLITSRFLLLIFLYSGPILRAVILPSCVSNIRLLFAKIGIPHCPVCRIELKTRTIDEIVEQIKEDFSNKGITIASSLTNGESVDVQKTIKELQKQGYSRVIIENKEYHLDEQIKKRKTESLSVVVDRVDVIEKDFSRLAESIEKAVSIGKGRVEINNNKVKGTYSIYAECIDHDYEVPEEIHPRLFSFNHYSS